MRKDAQDDAPGHERAPVVAPPLQTLAVRDYAGADAGAAASAIIIWAPAVRRQQSLTGRKWQRFWWRVSAMRSHCVLQRERPQSAMERPLALRKASNRASVVWKHAP